MGAPVFKRHGVELGRKALLRDGRDSDRFPADIAGLAGSSAVALGLRREREVESPRDEVRHRPSFAEGHRVAVCLEKARDADDDLIQRLAVIEHHVGCAAKYEACVAGRVGSELVQQRVLRSLHLAEVPLGDAARVREIGLAPLVGEELDAERALERFDLLGDGGLRLEERLRRRGEPSRVHYGEDGLDACEVVGELMKESGYLADQRILNDWAKNGGADLDWYLGAYDGIAWLEKDTDPAPADAEVNCKLVRNPLPELWEGNDDEYYKCFQCTIKVSPTHVPVLEANLKAAEDTGNLTEVMGTRAVKLIREEGGAVTGVIGKVYETGEFVHVNAKAVILSTGDISGNADFMHYYLPRFDNLIKIFGNVDPNGDTVNTADGQIMGMLAGVMLEDQPFAPMTHQMGASKGMGSACFLELNRDGERFCNEDVPGQQLENQIEAQPGQYTYQFFDGAWADELPYFKPEHGAACYVLSDEDIANGVVDSTLSANDCYASQGAIDEGVADGSILKADTIDELLELIGAENIDIEIAKASIERYNEVAAGGADVDFGKKGSRTFALDTLPFYAVKMTPTVMLVCLAGLKSDHKGRTYDSEGNIVPGLYVAGNVQGDRIKVAYPTTVPGISHSLELTGGCIAARSVAEVIAWPKVKARSKKPTCGAAPDRCREEGWRHFFV